MKSLISREALLDKIKEKEEELRAELVDNLNLGEKPWKLGVIQGQLIGMNFVKQVLLDEEEGES